MTLEQYIKENYESNVDFAEKNNVIKQQVNVWLRLEFIVVDGVMYSKRRKLAPL